MRAMLLAAVLAVSLSLATALPNLSVCDAESVQLELRPTKANEYQLAFVAIDPRASNNKADFIDIHYRVNNEDAVNLRVLTEAAITNTNERAKQAQIEGIQLDGGDVIRAYATYASNGIACDTAIHTFNAPETRLHRRQPMRHSGVMMPRDFRSVNQFATSAVSPMRRRSVVRGIDRRLEDEFWSQAVEEAELNHAAGACPALAFDQDILKQSGMRDTYVLSFENKTPAKQLHYVDLHLATDAAEEGWENLRLASDMQLDLAHKVMQPGVVVKPNEKLSWYWSYRTSSADGIVVDCTTPINVMAPHQVTHEVDLNQINLRI